jgi:hypothetical protein
MEKKQSKEKSKKYKVVFDTVGIKHKAEGKTALDALSNLDITWDKIKNKGVITLSKGSKKAEHLFVIKQLRRIFVNKTVMALWAKRLELMFK